MEWATIHGIDSGIVFFTLSDVLCVRCQYSEYFRNWNEWNANTANENDENDSERENKEKGENSSKYGEKEDGAFSMLDALLNEKDAQNNTEKNKPSIAIVGIPVNNEYWAGQQYISGITIL